MVVKHRYRPDSKIKMDDQPQSRYYRKNWSSFVLWNCAHPKNKHLDLKTINTATGTDLHGFSWLSDSDIGVLPTEYNWIEGTSPKTLNRADWRPEVIHYTLGGPWFPEYQDVMYGDLWIEEYERWQATGVSEFTNIPSLRYESEEIRK